MRAWEELEEWFKAFWGNNHVALTAATTALEVAFGKDHAIAALFAIVADALAACEAEGGDESG